MLRGLGTDLYMVAEVPADRGWRLAEPMVKNDYRVEPRPGDELLSDHAEYEPVFHTPGRDDRFYVFLLEHGQPGFPSDLSEELRRYLETYWPKGSRTSPGRIAYRDVEPVLCFEELSERDDAARLRLVFWFC